VTANFTYGGLDRLFELAHTKPPATLAIHQYAYNNANNISSWLGSSGNRSFNYDNADRLTSVLKMGGNESYGYDAVGNRTTSHLSSSYSYQPFNRLTSTTTATYAYDSNGNMLTKTDSGGTRTFGWDSDNRLKQVVLPGGLTVSYKYDALGRRIQRTTSTGADERFVYDGQDVLLDLNSSLAVVTSYINGLGIDDHLRQTNTTTGVSYFLTDHLGTTTTLTDGSGNVVETLAYDSFGNNAGSTRTRYTYTGRERDADTGLLYYRARVYDPQLGRFISEDPIGLADGINPFAYVRNNPAGYTDPSGLCAQDPKDAPTDPCASNLLVEFDLRDAGGEKNINLIHKTVADGFLKALLEINQVVPGGISFKDVFRDSAMQARRRAAYEAGRGAGARRPGTSSHEAGMAVDVAMVDVNKYPVIVGIFAKYGWIRPFNKEPWHFEPEPLFDKSLIAAAQEFFRNCTPMKI